MQDRVQLTINGQELQQADVNQIGKEASLADDRVLAELLRLAPFNGTTYAKAILPYTPSGTGNSATVLPGTGGVTINPFRAVVGSRTAAATTAIDNWNDVRSAIYTGSTTALAGTQTFTANASGNPRWDLLYVAVASDANGASVTRYIKNAATKVVSATSVVGTLTTTATLGVVTGTAGASPAFPSLPSDTGTTIYIPLALVRIINGFSGATVLNNKDIYEVAPVVPLSRATGVSTLRPADQQYLQAGTAITGSGTSAIAANGANSWTGTTNTRPGSFLPPSWTGSESLIIAVDLVSASSANWSHQSGAVIDASRDWRNRLFKWTACIGPAGTNSYPWATNTNPTLFSGGGSTGASTPGYASGIAAPYVVGVGNSFYTVSPSILTLVASGAAATAAPAAGANVGTAALVSGTYVALQVSGTTGVMSLFVSGTPLVSLIIWLDATSQFPNT